MVFGLVLGFLEGRRNTEALTAGLCASFILADGVTKSVGAWLLNQGVSERWMPGVAGLLFLPPLLVFVWMLTRIPRSQCRTTSPTGASGSRWTAASGWRSCCRYGLGLAVLVAAVPAGHDRPEHPGRLCPGIMAQPGNRPPRRPRSPVGNLGGLGVLVVNGLSVLIVG